MSLFCLCVFRFFVCVVSSCVYDVLCLCVFCCVCDGVCVLCFVIDDNMWVLFVLCVSGTLRV